MPTFPQRWQNQGTAPLFTVPPPRRLDPADARRSAMSSFFIPQNSRHRPLAAHRRRVAEHLE
jgi:hypothetical protein